MKKFAARLLSLTLVLATVLTLCVSTSFTAYAYTYVSGANSASSSYMNGKYYNYVASVPLTGDGRRDVVAVALSQLGYQESNSAGNYSGLSSGQYGNYTEYNYNMGNFGEGYAYYWCATFVSWALLQARCTTQNTMNAWCRNHVGDINYIWREVSCSQWTAQLKRFGYFQKSKAAGGSYTPQPGDLIFFSWSGATSTEDHIGIVVYSDGTNVYTVEGNTSDASGLDDNGGGVYYKSYSLGYNCITGYGVLPYQTVSPLPAIDYSMANPVTGLYMTHANTPVYTSATGSSYSYTAAKYTMFETSRVESNGRLYATFTTTSGASATGWVNPGACVPLCSTEKIEGGFSIAHTTVASYGSSYTATAPDRGDAFDDDGLRLTDGTSIPSDLDYGGASGWTRETNTVEIVLDLGESKWTNHYNVYFAGGKWGIGLPEGDVTVEIQVSNDRSSFETVSPAGSGYYLQTSGSGVADETWSTYNYYTGIEKDVHARYIKYIVTNTKGGFIWLTEVDAVLDLANDTVVREFNSSITAGNTVIFTPEYNGGALTATNTNTTWTTNVVVEWNSRIGQYVVVHKENGLANGWNLKKGQYLIASHSWEGEDVDGSITGSTENRANLNSTTRFQVGDIVRFNGIDLSSETLESWAYVESVAYLGDVTKDVSVNAFDYLLLKRNVLGTYELSGGQQLSADLDGISGISAFDYAMLKRHCCGTYVIKQNF